jgi:Tol biopolymer transport system component
VSPARVGLVAGLALAVSACSSKHATVKNGVIAANWQGRGIALVDPATAHRALIPRTDSASALAWSPDGRTLSFVLPGKLLGADVYTVGRDGSGLRLVAENAYGPSWSPDGKRLLIARDAGNFRVDLDTIRPAGGGLRRISRQRDGVFSPTWSPTGGRIAFLGSDDALYLLRADGRQRRRLAGRFGTHLSWSPDGSTLAFEIRGISPDLNADIGTVDVETGKRRTLTHDPGDEFAPAWSPDGREIAYVANTEIWLMDADGGDQRQLTHDGGRGYDELAWQRSPAQPG